jgi:hypothetical protein
LAELPHVADRPRRIVDGFADAVEEVGHREVR